AVLADHGIALGNDFLPNRLDHRVIDSLVGEFAKSGLATDEADGGSMVGGELAFEAPADVPLVAQILDERRHAQADGLDLFRLYIVLVPKLNAGIYGRVRDNSAWKRLVGIFPQVELVA